MVDIFPHNIWSRPKWQQERDTAKVSAGACPRMSVAAELDRFHAEMAKGFNPGSIHAAKRLEERIKTYVGSIGARHPSWARRVAAQVGERAYAAQSEFEKIGRAAEGFNKAILMVQRSFEAAEADIEDWMRAGGGTRLESRQVDQLLAGLRELYINGQRLTYVNDRLERGVWSDARRYWSAMDGRRAPDYRWLEGVNELRVRLRPA